MGTKAAQLGRILNRIHIESTSRKVDAGHTIRILRDESASPAVARKCAQLREQTGRKNRGDPKSAVITRCGDELISCLRCNESRQQFNIYLWLVANGEKHPLSFCFLKRRHTTSYRRAHSFGPLGIVNDDRGQIVELEPDSVGMRSKYDDHRRTTRCDHQPDCPMYEALTPEPE